jgi:hypothetical protein
LIGGDRRSCLSVPVPALPTVRQSCASDGSKYKIEYSFQENRGGSIARKQDVIDGFNILIA